MCYGDGCGWGALKDWLESQNTRAKWWGRVDLARYVGDTRKV